MAFQWIILFLVSVFCLHVSCYKICELRDDRVFCQCDDYEVDSVRVVSCVIQINITGEDDIWSGFHEQRLVDSFSINGRNGGGVLTSVPVHALKMTKQVRQIAFTSNKLGILWSNSFSNLDKLDIISLEDNAITGLEVKAFSNLVNLTKLILSENSIQVLPLDALHHLPNLKELYIDRNQLGEIADQAFHHLHALQEMDLNSNNLNHISSKTFVGLRTLRRLDLSRNSLVSLKDRIFRGSPNLQDLDLSRNRITEITPHAFDGLKHLQRLNLRDNKMFVLQKTVFKGAPHLLHINLADNKLVTFQKHILDPLINVSNTEFFINLKGNTFECRCDMLWIPSFVNNTKTFTESQSFKKELRSLKCYFGEHLRSNLVNVMDLKRDEIECPDPPFIKSSPVYHAPYQTSPHHKYFSPTTTTTTTTTSTTTTTPRPSELEHVQTPPIVAEVSQVEIRSESTTVKAKAATKATSKASRKKIEAKNIELSDAAESTGREPKPKSAPKKMDDPNACSSFGPSLQTLFLLVLFLQTYLNA